MFFCPKCNFSLDITKNIPTDISGDIQLKNPKDFVVMFLNDDLVGNIKLIFSKKDLLKLKDYKKLSDDNKNNILNQFNEINMTGFNIAYFICQNCQFITKLNQGTKIYEVSLKSKLNNNTDILVNIHDNTLPRTKDYICPNSKCNSHNNDHNKEALFFRPTKNSYSIRYICTICNTFWNIGCNTTNYNKLKKK